MDQRSDDIRNNIENTRASLDDKLDQLEHRAKETFDLSHQIQEHPFMMFGAAVAAGYVLGSMGGNDHGSRYEPQYSSGYGQHHSSSSGPHHQKDEGLLSQFDDEINMLKAAAIGTVTSLLKDIVKEVAPAIGKQMDKLQGQRKQLPDSAHAGTGYSGTGSGGTAYSATGSRAPESGARPSESFSRPAESTARPAEGISSNSSPDQRYNRGPVFSGNVAGGLPDEGSRH